MAKNREQKGMIVWILVLSILLAASFLLYVFLTEEGRKAELGIYISEAVSSNSGSLFDDEYGTPDWIELINLSDRPIDLAGYSIARIGDSGSVFYFPEIVVQPGSTLVLYACEKREDTKGQLCTGFKLPRSGTTLELAAPSGTVIQTLLLPALQTDVSYGLTESGEYAFYTIPTPNAPNTGRAIESMDQPDQTGGTLRITECLPYGVDKQYTWVELYNYGTEPVLLSQFFLTDDPFKADKCRLPSVNLEPGAYIEIPFSDGSGGYALSFGINRQEDFIGLYDSFGNQLSSLRWDLGMEAGFSVGLNEKGAMVYFSAPTPGAKNDESTAKTPAQIEEGITPVRINEVLRDNRYSLIDSFGDRSPWVELYNPTDAPVSLATYALSDDAEERFKWMLPNITLNPGEFLVVFLSGRDVREGSELHTSFKLGSADVCVTLADRRIGLVQTVPIHQESGKNVSFGVNAEEQWAYFAQPTPGAANTTANFPELAAAMEAVAPAVLINEVAAAKPLNSSHRDWVELHNGSGETVDLTGWRLSASPDPERGVALTGTLKPGGYLVVKDGLSVSASGEVLYLFDASGRLVDRYATGLIRPGHSTGLSSDGGRAIFTSATPGAANGDSRIRGYTAAPVFSQQGGYVSEAFEMTIACTTEGATIYYTTDGSKPTTNSRVYSGPIRIEKNTCVKAVAKAEGMLMSDQMVATYLFETHTIPVICLSIDEGDLSYISASENRRDRREREAYAEYYTKDGVLGVRFPMGMRIGGNGTRLYPQRTFSLHLRGGYGQSSVTYPFFEGYGVKEYRSLVLRNFGQDNGTTLLRDAYCSMAVNGMNIDNAQSTFVTVYINGKYWGLYEFKENQNEDYFAEKYGVDPNVMQGVRSNTYVYNGVGNNRGIKDLFALAAKDTSADSIYAQYAEKADEDMFIDYLIAQCFFSNSDAYNQKYMGSTDGSMKWRPVFYDLDYALSGNNPSRNVFGMFFRPDVIYVGVPDEEGNRNFVDMGLYYGFYKNAGWREKFVTRFAEVMNTVLTTDRLVSLLDSMAEMIEPEMARHISRWKRPSSVSGWKGEVEAFRQCVTDRRANYLKEFKRAFSVSDARMKELFPNDY
jgi:hypothetical protein